MKQIATGVWRGGTRYVNWYLLDTGDRGVVLVDAGLPGYRRTLEPELRDGGFALDDVKAVYLTHGHVDHVGTADVLAARGAPVYLHEADRGLAEDPSTNTTERSPVPYLRWPATLAFVVHAVRNGAGTPAPMPPSIHPTPATRIDAPGSPLVHHLPGHTAGSCAFEFPEHDVTFVGDALCTASPVTGRQARPQVQSRASNASSTQALASLDRLLDLRTQTLLPGHGGPWTAGPQEAVEHARRHGCR